MLYLHCTCLKAQKIFCKSIGCAVRKINEMIDARFKAQIATRPEKHRQKPQRSPSHGTNWDADYQGEWKKTKWNKKFPMSEEIKPWFHQDSWCHQPGHVLCRSLQQVVQKYLHVALVAAPQQFLGSVILRICLPFWSGWSEPLDMPMQVAEFLLFPFSSSLNCQTWNLHTMALKATKVRDGMRIYPSSEKGMPLK